MSQFCREDLDEWLESWAKWISGGDGLMSSLSRLANVRTGSDGGGGLVVYEDQERTEFAIIQLAHEDDQAARVIRIEYGIRPKGVAHSLCHKRNGRAKALGMSYSTYRRKLIKANAFISDYLVETNPA